MSTDHRDTHTSGPGTARPSRGTVVAALGAVCLVSVAALAAAAPAEALDSAHGRPDSRRPVVHLFRGPLTDLQPTTGAPLDGARARLVLVQHHGSTTFVLLVSGVDPAGAGQTYGAHLHTGPCVAGDGAAAGPHYNQSTVAGIVPPVVDDRTEVWLDVTVGPDGEAVAVTRVPFVPAPGNRAVVLHALATDEHGTAGARLACLPVSWS